VKFADGYRVLTGRSSFDAFSIDLCSKSRSTNLRRSQCPYPLPPTSVVASGRGLIEHNLSLACLEPDGERKILAGVNRMPWPHFMLANIIGACLWASRLAAYSLGRQVERLAGWMVFVFGPPPFLC
jgi:hypothetical protein